MKSTPSLGYNISVMKVFFTSDNHFFHARIIKYCNRPFADADHMNFEMSSKWNSVVKDEDVVIHLGDISAGLGRREDQLKALISSLKGRKFLIRGNHDHQTDKWYEEAGFEKVFGHLSLGGVLLLHYSLFTASEFGVNIDSFGCIEHVVHGHSHQTEKPDHENHFNVAVDRHDFMPVEYKNAIPEQLQSSFIDALIQLL